MDLNNHTIVAAFDNANDARAAVDALLQEGISRSTIQVQPELDTNSADVTGTTSATQDTGSGIGAFFRSLFGADEEYRSHQDIYAESVRRGHYIVTVDSNTETELQRASEVLNRFNPVDIDERASYWKTQGWSGYDEKASRFTADQIAQDRNAYGARDTTRIPVIQEDLKVGKRMVQSGGVRVFQRVRETPVNEQVTLREEHVNVERRPVDRPASEADLAAFKEGSVEMREMAEEAVVSKTARVVEEVDVSKQAQERTEKITDTVRRTDVEVQNLGAGDSGAAGMQEGAVIGDDDFRQHWQKTYGTSGGRYEDYGDAYRYGSQMAGSEKFRNYRWEEAEPEWRSDWEASHPGTSTWEKVKDAVRYGAERVSGKTQRRH